MKEIVALSSNDDRGLVFESELTFNLKSKLIFSSYKHHDCLSSVCDESLRRDLFTSPKIINAQGAR